MEQKEELLEYLNPMLEIQKQCKEKFPIGCSFINTEGVKINVLSEDNVTYTIHDTSIWANNGAGCLYKDGEWAALVENKVELETNNYKELQDKAWEIFKNVKKGDKYISTRGCEYTATKDAFKSKGFDEYNCYIDCGPGFL